MFAPFAASSCRETFFVAIPMHKQFQWLPSFKKGKRRPSPREMLSIILIGLLAVLGLLFMFLLMLWEGGGPPQ
jgi:hypothetical protein